VLVAATVAVLVAATVAVLVAVCAAADTNVHTVSVKMQRTDKVTRARQAEWSNFVFTCLAPKTSRVFKTAEEARPAATRMLNSTHSVTATSKPNKLTTIGMNFSSASVRRVL
jgi:hypothetical protein